MILLQWISGGLVEMQLPRVSFQAFMTLSAPRALCCSGSAGLAELAPFLTLVDLYIWFFFLIFFASLQPLHSLLAMVNHWFIHHGCCASEMERGGATASYARWKFLLSKNVTMQKTVEKLCKTAREDCSVDLFYLCGMEIESWQQWLEISKVISKICW